MKFKKSQSGINAAILVAIIATMIIIYIVFLPAAEKEKFFGSNATTNGESLSSSVLLKEFPKTISAVSGVEAEKLLPNVFLFEETNAKELLRINPFIISSSSFSQKSKTEEFVLDEFENADNVMLSFKAKTRTGVLTIKLNDKAIFEGQVAEESVKPIKINRNLLAKSNKLEFSVSSPGASFWKTNTYSLEDILLIGDITDRVQQESKNIFVLTDTEFNNLQKATLMFIPYCGSNTNVGKLVIFINNKEIFSSVPICDDPYKQVIPTGALREKDNTIIFKTSRGSYSIEQIIAKLEFKEAKVKPYFFELNREQMKEVNQSKKELVATLKFVDDENEKNIIMDYNGHKKSIETTETTFTRKLSVNETNEGNNFIRLIPVRDDVDIVELKVELVKK